MMTLSGEAAATCLLPNCGCPRRIILNAREYEIVNPGLAGEPDLQSWHRRERSGASLSSTILQRQKNTSCQAAHPQKACY
jgi:hypothetical protein